MAGDEESAVGLGQLQSRFLAALGLTACWYADSRQTFESKFLVKSCLGNDVIKALTDAF